METGTTQLYQSTDLLKLYEEAFGDISFGKKNDQSYRAVNYFLSLKGKRIRPLLLMHASQMFGGNIKDALYPAFGIELFHNFTLIHDDIMDKADIRRGFPSVHKKFNEGTAILAGDLMFILSYKYLSHVEPKFLLDVLDLFNATAQQVIKGQQMDSEFETRIDVEENEYLEMIEYKTSVLLAASLKLGAILAGASSQCQDLIYDFGKNLGLAFQIKDDWLDVYGNNQLGKKIGGDIVQNKRTYLFVKACQKADEQQKQLLFDLQNETDGETKITKTMEVYDELNVDQDAGALMDSFYNRAITSFERIELPDSQKEALSAFAEKIYHRDY